MVLVTKIYGKLRHNKALLNQNKKKQKMFYLNKSFDESIFFEILQDPNGRIFVSIIIGDSYLFASEHPSSCFLYYDIQKTLIFIYV